MNKIFSPPNHIANSHYTESTVFFELKEDEGLKELIEFAGGLKANTYLKRAKINSVQDKIKFEVGSAEKMRYDSNSFDLVFGVGLLHHVNIAVAAPEIYRVLKDGGQAVFIDPIVFSNILDKIRHSALVTYFVPDEGVEVLITEDEHQINIQEYSILDKTFNTCDYKSFRLLSRLDRIICGYPVDENNIIVRFLNILDRFLLNNFTFLKKFGGWGVISVKK